jgi:cytochrome c oxidase subunit II
VTGHQWWWEFKYPELGITTANELYLPKGRTVNFALKTIDVIHSFWIPALGGKRDLIANRTNYIWFTPDSLTEKVFNGVCVEYCGASHANMRFRAFVVDPAEFDSWAAHQKTQAAFMLPKPPVAGSQVAGPVGTKTATRQPANPPIPAAAVVTQTGYSFPTADMPKHTVAFSPVPDGLTFDDALLAQGDAARGADLVHNKIGGGCIGCHAIAGTNFASTVGPNLTHIASRNTIGAGLFPNDAKHLALWIKNARRMKPGIVMPTIGATEIDPQLKKAPTGMAALTDAQIADVVAYLRSLK